ncbi:hypothetical protein EC973_003922 [Apophysomyces ossiformis]|uniref:Uncharacterized protein n=1 Tax=Apophysomyces ossiformis TaxID=679940 RepID=A0A8H7BQQ8_9FUNG|nr:hypothetical protein EC973_003922 [Apophysomyces ossiformis]
MTTATHSEKNGCLLDKTDRLYEPQAGDILKDEDLLNLFHIIKQILRKRPDAERLAKLLFCVSYALGDCIKFSKPAHHDKILFMYNDASVCAVRLPQSSSCCPPARTREGTEDCLQSWIQDSPKSSSDSSIFSLERSISTTNTVDLPVLISDGATENCTIRSYTHFRPVYRKSFPDRESIRPNESNSEIMEPTQRGFYYQDGRLSREPVLLQRYAEQGVLTQASIIRKRKRLYSDSSLPSILPIKKPKIPHRHGEFEQRRDDIIQRMKNITLQDLEQKARNLPADFCLSIDCAEPLPPSYHPDQVAELLKPTLRILIHYSNMKPHLDNGMNQNGIFYNTDYFKLYMAFEQFQNRFAALFPDQLAKPDENDKDKERNTNMKAYRTWIEPLLAGNNWAAFRRNIVVGERIHYLTKVVGQGVLLMTKELSGSKLHLTFTNNEWDEFIHGLEDGRWDHLSSSEEGLASELRSKLATEYWFHWDGFVVSPEERRNAQLLQPSSAMEKTTEYPR